ncbi:hypothetical protein L209DRAFT_104372 [Thermothelomyces heterothallicus CBS 203.75]
MGGRPRLMVNCVAGSMVLHGKKRGHWHLSRPHTCIRAHPGIGNQIPPCRLGRNPTHPECSRQAQSAEIAHWESVEPGLEHKWAERAILRRKDLDPYCARRQAGVGMLPKGEEVADASSELEILPATLPIRHSPLVH